MAIKLSVKKLPNDDGNITNKLRKDWNDYVSWLDTKGLKGHPSLDSNDLGGKMVEQYQKENPNTLVSRQSIPAIQQEFQKYRDYVLNQVKAGKATLSPGVTPDNFMYNLSKVDGIPGQRTTSFQFPQSYLKTFESGNLVSNENKGFATTNK